MKAGAGRARENEGKEESQNATPLPLPVVALIGRPNVGKSSLFNRLERRRRAIVDPKPGVTRDRNYALVEAEGKPFWLVDTGGVELPVTSGKDSEALGEKVWKQTGEAAREATSLIVLLDGQAGVSAWDREFIRRVRRLGKPMTFAVNKIDLPSHGSRADAFYELGLPEVVRVSAETGLGLGELLERVGETLPMVPVPQSRQELKIAIVGRPNVGKSSLLNRIVGSPRAVVDPVPGTTRDCLDTPVVWGGQSCLLIDTAGIRRAGRVERGVERVSVLQSFRSIERSDLVLLLLDGLEGPTEQDAKIAGEADRQGKGVILIVNKCDLIPSEDRREEILKAVRFRCHYLPAAPAHFVSALQGTGVDSLWDLVAAVAAEGSRWVPTPALNRVLQGAIRRHEPGSQGRTAPKFLYATQTAVRPPTFLIFVSHASRVHFSYQRYLVNEIRAAFALTRTPIRIRFRTREH